MPSPGHIASPAHPPHPVRRAMIPHVISPRQGHVRPPGRLAPDLTAGRVPGKAAGSRRGAPIGAASLRALGS